MVVAPGAAVGAHHHRRLAGEGGEGGFARRALRDMPGERRLADAGVAEQPEHLRLAVFQPLADPVDRLGLLARPLARPEGLTRGAGAARGRCGAAAAAPSAARLCRLARRDGFGASDGCRLLGSTLAPQREQVGGLRPRS